MASATSASELAHILAVAVHGPTAACHELHTERPGSFGEISRAISGARDRGRRVFVGTWLTRSTCRSLVQMVDWLVGTSVVGWTVVWPRVAATGLVRASRTVPRLGIAAPHALRAVQRAQQRGLAVAVVGIPSCVLGPFAALRIPGPRAGTPAPPCAECPARDDCAALDPWYLDRFGPGELHPVPPVPRNPRAPWIVSGLEAAARAVDEGQ